MTLSRTLTVPAAIAVRPTVWVRARQGPNLADLIAQAGTVRSHGDADLIDVEGRPMRQPTAIPHRVDRAAERGRPPQPPTLTVTLPAPPR